MAYEPHSLRWMLTRESEIQELRQPTKKCRSIELPVDLGGNEVHVTREARSSRGQERAHQRRGGRSRPSNGEAASRSATDRTAVVLCDDHDRRSRRHPVLEVRPAARGFLEGRREVGQLARVLRCDEQGPAVRRELRPAHLGASGAGEEELDHGAPGPFDIAAVHPVRDVVLGLGVALVGRDPEPARRIDRDVVGR